MSESPVDRRTMRKVIALRRSRLTTPICLLLAASNVAWRQDAYFTGSLDPTVLAKAILGLLALLLSAVLALASQRRWPVSATPLLLLFGYLAITMIGAIDAGTTLASLVLVVRVVMTAVTVMLLLVGRPMREVAQSLVRSLAIVGTVAAVTGIPNLATGRLSGGVPQIAANELALIFSICALWIGRKVVRGAENNLDRAMLLTSVVIVFLTGSRTGLVALVLAFAIMARYTQRISMPTLVGGLIALPVLAAIALNSSTISRVVDRGGSSNVSTLSNRTIAWQAAFSYHDDPVSTWFGSGLSTKKVPVTGQYWNTQILDSTWVSGLVQGGYAGLIMLTLLVIVTLAAVLQASAAWRPLLLSLTVMLVLRSFLESGLFDASLGFLFILLVSMGAPYTDLGPGDDEQEAISLLKATSPSAYRSLDVHI